MPTVKKKSTTVKTANKRAPAKTTSTKVTRVVKPAHAQMRSFHPAENNESFFTFRLTHQTLYWLILSLIVLALGIWVININTKVQGIYDQIDEINRQTLELDTMQIKKL